MITQISREDGLYYRQTLFDKAKRIVIKVGSAVLTNESGINQNVVENIARDLSFLKDTGREVILVTSGAVAAGKKKIVLSDTLKVGLKEKQALAAIGQSCLMQTYDEVFQRHGKIISQLLLTHADLASRDRYLNVRNTILTLLRFGAIPIINENDPVSGEELRFGDNDTLGALVTNLIEADMFICLTDVDCLYTGNPLSDPEARPVYTVARVTPEIEAMAGNVKSALGTGGMQTKIRAAKMVAAGGGSSFIGPGRNGAILQELFSGEMIGTFFLPAEDKIQRRKHWIAYVLRPKGYLVLDAGACTALCKHGKSLLSSGILEVRGEFGVGEAVHCLDNNNQPIAAGLINYSSVNLDIIKGHHSDVIESLLGFKDCDEVIHRDNLVLL
ncbi:MAG: glutamate 5-kinase [Desulfocapsaceae bacterium]|jgi:glutamate 5-kinase|nr:glutamate 5-kinase [Desulfocapsaceae bacterium]